MTNQIEQADREAYIEYMEVCAALKGETVMQFAIDRIRDGLDDDKHGIKIAYLARVRAEQSQADRIAELEKIALELEDDMHRYLYDNYPERRIKCLTKFEQAHAGETT